MKNLDPDVINEIRELLLLSIDTKDWSSVEEALDVFEREFVPEEEEDDDILEE